VVLHPLEDRKLKLQIIVILLAIVGIATGLAQLGEEHVTITVTSEGKVKIFQTLFPKTFVSTIDVHIISEKISNLLAIDEKNILLGTTQNEDLLKIATLGASAVDLKYNAGILTYESGVFRLKYNSELESQVNLPPLSKLVSLNTIPVEITEKEYVLPPGDISLSYTIRPVTSKEFFVTVGDLEQKVEAITAAKIEEFSANEDRIQFIIKDKATILTIIPKEVLVNPNDALLNGEKVEFSQFHQNATHSWIRVEPHEKGLVKILNEKSDEGGGCLIATATYGSEMAPQVQFLREIRDNQLMNTDSGVSFMNGFNQLYYSFSPTIADLERENPAFKEFVKIGITPMLLSLSIMAFAESEHEILGVGITVILINIGMYFVLPFVIFYFVWKKVRTIHTRKSNRMIISRNSVLSVLNIRLFGIIALLVLVSSVTSAFESAYADEDDPIKIVLDLTYQNILESRADAGEIPDNAETFFAAGEEKYNEALAALEAGDIDSARDNALIAMALFEDSAQEIGAIQEQISPFSPGFDVGIDDDLDDVPVSQFTSANIFDVQEEITGIDEEVDGLRELIESNNFDVNFEDYEESVNSAKESLANGDISGAHEKIDTINEIKNDLYEQINVSVQENQEERVDEFAENRINDIQGALDNLELDDDETEELKATLEVLQEGDADKIFEQTGEDSPYAKQIEENDDLARELDDSGDNASTDGESTDEAPTDESTDDAPTDESTDDAPTDESTDDAPTDESTDDAPTDNNSEGFGENLISSTDEDDSFDGSITADSFGSQDDFYEYNFEGIVDDPYELNFDGTPQGLGGKGLAGSEGIVIAGSVNKPVNSGGGSSTNDNVNVGDGDTLVISGQTINGNIIMTGGSLTITGGSTINGNVEVTGGTLTLNGASLVTGNVLVSGSDPVTIQNITVNGSVEVGTTLNLVISGNTILGSLLDLDGNTGCNVFNNDVSGSTTFNCTILTAVNDVAYSAQNPESVIISVLSNDGGTPPLVVTDPPSNPPNGSVTTDGTTITYTPDASFTGTDTFTYEVSNADGADTATVTVIVDDYTLIITDIQGDISVGSSQHTLIWNGGTINSVTDIANGGELTVAIGGTVSGSILTSSGSSLTIDGATNVGGTITAVGVNPLIIKNTDIDGSINIQDSENITITGTDINGNINDNTGNVGPCDISSNTGNGAGDSISCAPPAGAPSANAGSDQAAAENEQVTLDGTGSNDSDGTVVSWKWTQTGFGGLVPVTLSDDTAESPTFDAPSSVSNYEILTFSLVVTDNEAKQSTADTVNIFVYDTAVYTHDVDDLRLSQVVIGTGQSYLIIGSADLQGGLLINDGSLVMLSGANVKGDVISNSGDNSITIDDVTIDGSIKTQDADSTNPFIVRDSDITGSINIGKATNIEVTGNNFSGGGSITDETGNSAPCIISGNTGASSVFSCPLP